MQKGTGLGLSIRFVLNALAAWMDDVEVVRIAKEAGINLEKFNGWGKGFGPAITARIRRMKKRWSWHQKERYGWDAPVWGSGKHKPREKPPTEHDERTQPGYFNSFQVKTQREQLPLRQRQKLIDGAYYTPPPTEDGEQGR